MSRTFIRTAVAALKSALDSNAWRGSDEQRKAVVQLARLVGQQHAFFTYNLQSLVEEEPSAARCLLQPSGPNADVMVEARRFGMWLHWKCVAWVAGGACES